MRLGVILSFSFIFLVVSSFTHLDNDIRSDFQKAIKSEALLAEVIENPNYPSNDVTIAYQGLATCMSAEYATWPTTKWNFFTTGKELIEQSITSSPLNPEIRYIRLMVQLNVPSLVSYDENISSDFDFFVQEIPSYSVTSYWKRKFIDNLLSSKHLESNQSTQLKSLKSQIQ